jgi:ribosome-binding ATPase
MIAEVVRIFDDTEIHHVAGAVDPMSDIEVINLELVLADTETVAKRLSNLEKDVKRGDKEAIKEKEALMKILQALEAGKLANSAALNEDEQKIVAGVHLLTMKKFLYVLNKKQGSYNFDEQNDERFRELMEFFESTKSEYVIVDAGMEQELKDLSDDEKNEFRREYGSQDSGVDALIRAAYKNLGLISYFTTGEKETRAWTIHANSTAPVAGEAIHTDFKDKFIRAQVVSFKDLVESGSMSVAKEKGKVRTEGKGYIVQDGDVIEFMI